MKKNYRWIWISIILVALLDVALLVLLIRQRSTASVPVAAPPAASTASIAEPTPTPEPQPVVDEVRFSATGDDLIHDGIYLQAARRSTDGGYDFAYCYEHMKNFYSQFDLNWLNQETLINAATLPSGYPCFSTPVEIFPALYDVGFRAFNISTNHTYDQGALGLESTMEFWNSTPDDVAVSGLYDRNSYDNYTYQTVNGITFGYLSYTEHTNGIPTPSAGEYCVVYTNETQLIQQQMETVRPNCDFLVVSCHWGTEGSHEINDAQRTLAQQLSDWGADLVIGTHPHVVQDAEWLTGAEGNQTFVAYSLGNFLNYQSDADNLIGGILDLTFRRTTQPDGAMTFELVSPQIHPVVMHYYNGYQDGQAYPFADYTDELAAQHGIRSAYPNFTCDYIRQVFTEHISQEFIAW